MNYYNEIKENAIKVEIYDKAKDYQKDLNKVSIYYEIGKLLSEAGKEYGKKIIKKYADQLKIEVGKKYNERTLRKIRQFYEIFSKQKWSPLGTKLTWSHYRAVLALDDFNAIKYYLKKCEDKNLTKRQLESLIKSKEYERLPESTKEKLKNEETLEINDIIPNPIIIKGIESTDNLKEYTLKQAITSNLDQFLNNLGTGFCYIGSEYKIKVDDEYNYIDLLLFNTEFNCYVVVELKVTELNKNHIGQIKYYMNYIDENVKKINHDNTVGIIISKRNKHYVIEYASNEKILAREYEIKSQM